jgi:hypothetical protein
MREMDRYSLSGHAGARHATTVEIRRREGQCECRHFTVEWQPAEDGDFIFFSQTVSFQVLNDDITIGLLLLISSCMQPIKVGV